MGRPIRLACKFNFLGINRELWLRQAAFPVAHFVGLVELALGFDPQGRTPESPALPDKGWKVGIRGD